jgi:hypothetical protein
VDKIVNNAGEFFPSKNKKDPKNLKNNSRAKRNKLFDICYAVN